MKNFGLYNYEMKKFKLDVDEEGYKGVPDNLDCLSDV